MDNARYALNAANARWGRLYDALYGTDAIDESDGAQRGNDYNRVRGGKGVAFVRDYLDRHFPLTLGTHRHARRKKRSFAYGVWPTARRQFIPAALMAAPDGVENAVFSTLARRTSAFFACVKEALKNWS